MNTIPLIFFPFYRAANNSDSLAGMQTFINCRFKLPSCLISPFRSHSADNGGTNRVTEDIDCSAALDKAVENAVIRVVPIC